MPSDSAPAGGLPSPDRAAGPGRRVVLALGAASLAAVGLAACSSEGSGDAAGTAPEGSADRGSAPAGTGGAGSGGGTGTVLAALATIPVGGVVAAADPQGKPILIAQPQAGTVVAFSAVCTHQGCKVAPSGTTLVCPCHRSTFDPVTGKNLSGPAPSPLPAVAVKVQGTDVVAG